MNQLHDEIYPGGGVRVQHQLPQAAGGGAVRQAGPAPREKDKDRLVHQRRRAGRAAAASTRWWTRCCATAPLAKLKSTYCDGLLKVIGRGRPGPLHLQPDGDPHRAHLLHRAQPAEHPRAHRPGPRAAAVLRAATGGSLLVDADYSQIELRVLAHVAEDAEHDRRPSARARTSTPRTAAQVFHVPPGHGHHAACAATAKAVNFGIVYGIGAFSLRQGHRRHPQGGRRTISRSICAHYRRRGRLYEAAWWKRPRSRAMWRPSSAAGAICRS